jgi:hypothetical protein
MVVFIISTDQGWGKEESLTKAWQNYLLHNPKIYPGKSFGLTIYETPKLEDVGFSEDGLNSFYGSGSKLLYQNRNERKI